MRIKSEEKLWEKSKANSHLEDVQADTPKFVHVGVINFCEKANLQRSMEKMRMKLGGRTKFYLLLSVEPWDSQQEGTARDGRFQLHTENPDYSRNMDI